MNLRPYQENAITQIGEKFREGKKKVVFCLPTGGGKTITFSYMARQSIERGRRVLICTDRVELLTQAGGALTKAGLKPELINAGQRYLNPSFCYVAMVETLYKRISRPSFKRALGHLDLIIVDEAHKGSFRKILEAFPESYIIGATATPLSSSKKTPMCDLYDDIVEPVRISELIEMGYLVTAKTYAAKEEVAKMKTKNGEYTDESQMDFFGKTIIYDGVIENYNKLSPGDKALVFNVNVTHSKAMTEAFRNAGISSMHIDGSTPKHERKQILKDYTAGKFMVLNSVGTLTTGYDEPGVKTIILNRKTKSLPLYLQMCGRGSRLFENKSHFTIIDMGANFAEHGLWQQDTDWTEMFRNPKRSLSDAKTEAPSKACPVCRTVAHPTARKCSSCGYVFPEPQPEYAQASEFVEVVIDEWLNYDLQKKPEQMSVKELEFLQQVKGYKASWLFRQLRSRGEVALKEYASLKGYKPGWVDQQLEMAKAQAEKETPEWVQPQMTLS